MSRGGNVHESVFRELSKSKDLTESELSSIFNKLRVMRNLLFNGSVKNLTDGFSFFSQNISFCPI